MQSNKSVEIRLAQVSDVVCIAGCAAAAYQHYIERIGKVPAPMVADFQDQVEQGVVHVMTEAQELIGFAVCYACDDSLFLENIAIHPSQQGRGLGGLLLSYVEALEGDFGLIRLYTNEKMLENIQWYLSQGYNETDRRVEDGFARVHFEKRL